MRTASFGASWMLPLFVGLLGVALSMWRLSRPDALLGVHGYTGLGYDDGVYFGAALELVHGRLPYRDFVLVHPPGGALLLSPIAGAADLVGQRTAMGMARVLVGVAAGVNVALSCRLLRPYGVVAALTAGLLVLLHPAALPATHTVLLEPLLLLFCLGGLVTAFPDGALASGARLRWAGAFFGFACLIKLWAVLVVAPLLLVLLVRRPRRCRTLLLGVALGALPGLPFLLLSPAAFVEQVVRSQAGRPSTGQIELSQAARWGQMLGITGSRSGVPHAAAIWTAVGLVVMLVLVVGVRRRLRATDLWLSLLAIVGALLCGLLTSAEFYDHYAYIPAVFLTILIVASLAELASAVPVVLPRRVPVVLSAVVLLAAGVALPRTLADSRDYLRDSADPASVVAALVARGECVVTDLPTLLVIADRLPAADDTCPAVVDPFGLWLVDGAGQVPPATPPYPPAFVQDWRNRLSRADVVVLSVPFSSYIPFDPELATWFTTNFESSGAVGHVNAYRRKPAL